MTFPKRLHFKVVSSTNDYAKELVGEHSPIVVTADFQTFGRGRNKNVWEGAYGENVYFSLGLKHLPLKPIDEVAYLQGLGCLAVKATLEYIAKDVIFRLKYPNDIYVKCLDGIFRKISGVLVEHIFFGDLCEASVIGIGINVNQSEFDGELRSTASSLKNIGVIANVDYVVEQLQKNLFELLRLPKDKVFEFWKSELNILHTAIEVIGKEGIWEVNGFDNIGRLIVVNRATGVKIFVDNGDSIRYAIL